MKPLDYFNAKAAQEAAMQKSQRAGQPSGIGDGLLHFACDFFGNVILEAIGGAIELAVTAIGSIF